MSKKETNTSPLPTFSDSMAKLDFILNGLQGFMEIFESEKPPEDGVLNQELMNIAKTLNPSMSDEDAKEVAGTALLTYAFNEAREQTHLLMAAWGAANLPNPEKAETVMRFAQQARLTSHKVDKDKLITEMSWMLKGALEQICSNPIIKENPTSDIAVGARIIAVILNAVNEAFGEKKSLSESAA